MVTKDMVKHLAVMMAVRTGDMPNVDLIWARQRAEGYQDCFGQGLGCVLRHCLYRWQCLALDFFSDLTWGNVSGVKSTMQPSALVEKTMIEVRKPIKASKFKAGKALNRT